jgi:hypothetical protein
VYEVPGRQPGGGVKLIAIDSTGGQCGELVVRSVAEYNSARDALLELLDTVDRVGPRLVVDPPRRPSIPIPKPSLRVHMMHWHHLLQRSDGRSASSAGRRSR